MTQFSLSIDSLPAMADGRHFKCVRCDYDLFGSTDEQLCPECGHNVGESRRASSYLFDPVAVGTLRRGLGLLIGTTVLSILSIAVCFVWGVIVLDYPNRPDRAYLGALLASAVFIATLIISVKADIALWYSFDADYLKSEQKSRLRLFSIFAGAGLVGLTCCPWIFAVTMADRRPVLPLIVFGLSFALLTLAVPRFWWFYRALAELSRRLGWRRLGFSLALLARLKIVTDGFLLACMTAAPVLALLEEDYWIIVAFGALFGLMAFAAVWIFTIILQILLFRAARKHGQANVARGFEVTVASVSDVPLQTSLTADIRSDP